MRYNLRVIPYICSRYAEKGLSAVSIHRGASSELTGQIGKSTTVFFIFCREDTSKFSFFHFFLTIRFRMDSQEKPKKIPLLIE